MPNVFFFGVLVPVSKTLLPVQYSKKNSHMLSGLTLVIRLWLCHASGDGEDEERDDQRELHLETDKCWEGRELGWAFIALN